MEHEPEHLASAPQSSSFSAPSPTLRSAACKPIRATTSPSTSCRPWATRPTRAICAWRAMWRPIPSSATAPMPQFVLIEHGHTLRVTYQGDGASAGYLQGQLPGACHGHLWPGWRLPCHRAAGQVRFEICAGAKPGRLQHGRSFPDFSGRTAALDASYRVQSPCRFYTPRSMAPSCPARQRLRSMAASLPCARFLSA